MKVLKTVKYNSPSLTNRVYKNLRTDILTGKIKGGTRLVESNLATDMQVSRTPVREALHKLALEGLLYSIPRAGYIVEEMADSDVQDLFSTRLAIEQMAARIAIEKITENELRQFEDNLKRTDKALETGRTDKMTDWDMEFHGIIYKATRSKSMFQICQTLSEHTLRYRMALIHIPEMARKTSDGHHRIYAAIISKDASKVDDAIRFHLDLALEDIMDLLERKRQESLISEDLKL